MSGRLRFPVGGVSVPAVVRFLVVAMALAASVVAAPATAAAASSHHAGLPGAGCPVATPAQAGAAQPGQPTAVHAIAGNGSVTVTWCAPVQGQGSVTSYTVSPPPAARPRRPTCPTTT